MKFSIENLSKKEVRLVLGGLIMTEKIENLNNKDTFYNDVRALLKNKHYSDAIIKKLQRVADARYEELKKGN